MRRGVKIFAWRDIDKDTEITIDYRRTPSTASSSRRRVQEGDLIGDVTWSFFALDEERQRNYLPFTPDFIDSAASTGAGRGQ